MLHQPRTDAAAAGRFLDQHHGDPADRTEAAGAGSAHRPALELGHETAVGLQSDDPPPVSLGLIPTGLLLQPHA
jgi:hypothetical protein